MNSKPFLVLSMLLYLLAGPLVARAQTHAVRGADKPTIVLVHGAFEDGSAWQHVISRLQHDRYDVVAVQAPLTSLAADVQATRRVLDAMSGPVVLVGHSYGGAVITDAAAGDQRVKSLVYIAAFAPEAREVITAYGDKYPTPLGSALKTDKAGHVSVDPARFHDLFAKDVAPAQARVAAATQKPILGAAFGDAAVEAAWKSEPSRYQVATEAEALHPDLERVYADRMKAKTTEIKASHLVIVSHANAVARLIEEAARP